MTRYVFDFSEGDKDQKDLLGGKGANLAEMVKLGLPVPPGFRISTEACQAYLSSGSLPEGLEGEIVEHLATLEAARGKELGDPGDPLLVSVRSGARFSMPGMMETVLNIGLNDASVHGMAARSDNPRFAWDSYRRLIQMFGKTVQHIEGERFEYVLDELKRRRGAVGDLDLDADDLEELVEAYKRVVVEHTGRPFPQDPREQLAQAITAVFSSWNSERAQLYRRQERIPHDLGTAVNVCSMVFGNTGLDSGTGVCFTRDPATGAPGVYGDYLQNAQGEDVVAGIRNTVPLAALEQIDQSSYDELLRVMALLEGHYRDLCDIEFTIERGTLWMLQTRVGKRTAAAAFRIATQLVDEGLIDTDEALRRVSGTQLVQLMFPQFDAPSEKLTVLGRGLSASPGAAVGKAVFDSYTAVKWSRSGEKVILVRRETNPDDLDGMIASQGILTSRGGKTSHAAVVARGMGKTCVCGAEDLDVDTKRRQFTAPDGTVVHEGDVISVDGSSGRVYSGEVPVAASPVVEHFDGALDADSPEADELVRAVHRIVGRADEVRRLRVRANADTVEDAERARRFGAEGIGLCRTEHMFLGERRRHVEQLILAEDDGARAAALEALGKNPQPEIMIPLVGSVQELEIIEADARKVLAEVSAATGVELAPPLGTMIELSRAALTAGQIAEAAEFFSFGTNDLTQTTWGFSRDDVEAAFFSTYLEMGIFGVSPFETLDVEGVGELVRVGTERGRATRPDLKVGVCGEHGGDPDSVHFFHEVGLDYVSCSPFRIPVARLEAGRVALAGSGRRAER
jgi:pyruvate,orthophosphate dikinase